MWLHSRGEILNLDIRTALVRAVKFLSTRRSTLSTSLAGGCPVAVGPPAHVGPASG
jgi:hypothetical protein